MTLTERHAFEYLAVQTLHSMERINFAAEPNEIEFNRYAGIAEGIYYALDALKERSLQEAFHCLSLGELNRARIALNIPMET